MKKLAVILSVMLIFLASCEPKKCDCITNSKIENDTVQKAQYEVAWQKKFNPDLFKDEKTLITELNKLRLSEMEYILSMNHTLFSCTPALQAQNEERHNLRGDEAYFRYLARKSSDNTTTAGIKFYEFEWTEINKFLVDKKIKCYDGFLGVEFDSINSKINLVRYGVFDNTKTTYSEAFMRGVENKFAGTYYKPKTVYFTNAICATLRLGEYEDLPKIIFKVLYVNSAGDEKFEFFDMSDDPA